MCSLFFGTVYAILFSTIDDWKDWRPETNEQEAKKNRNKVITLLNRSKHKRQELSSRLWTLELYNTATTRTVNTTEHYTLVSILQKLYNSLSNVHDRLSKTRKQFRRAQQPSILKWEKTSTFISQTSPTRQITMCTLTESNSLEMKSLPPKLESSRPPLPVDLMTILSCRTLTIIVDNSLSHDITRRKGLGRSFSEDRLPSQRRRRETYRSISDTALPTFNRWGDDIRKSACKIDTIPKLRVWREMPERKHHRK